jgi:hypothetical protein
MAKLVIRCNRSPGPPRRHPLASSGISVGSAANIGTPRPACGNSRIVVAGFAEADTLKDRNTGTLRRPDLLETGGRTSAR